MKTSTRMDRMHAHYFRDNANRVYRKGERSPGLATLPPLARPAGTSPADWAWMKQEHNNELVKRMVGS